MSSTDTALRNSYDFSELASDRSWIDAYWELGYLIVRNVFSSDEIERIRGRFDRWYAEGMRHPSTFRHQNKIIWLEHDQAVGKIVRGMQWPSYEDEILDAVRTDQRIFAIVEPLIGGDLKQIINQMHWKTPGASVTWGLHRDKRSRKPDHAFRDLLRSYVQTGLAVDRHWAGNGAMKILPRSWKLAEHQRDNGSGHHDTGEAMWAASGVDMSELIDVEMEAGDVALWGPLTVHGGGINTTTDNARRLYINGYVIAENCDRGAWTFRDGQPVPLELATPEHIQYDRLAERPEAHYPGRDDLSSRVSD